MLSKLTVKFFANASRVKKFQNLQLLNQYLSVQQFPIHLVYFRAAWNPACFLTDEHIRQFSQTHNIDIIKVDSDVAPKISQHYGVRSEPQFVFCLEGDEIIRQIGPNYMGILQKHQKILQILKKCERNGLKWTPYGSKFQKFYKENLKYIYPKVT